MNEMLKGIPKIVPPELLKVLAEMGHSDRIVIADGNFLRRVWERTALLSGWTAWCAGGTGRGAEPDSPGWYVEHPMSLMEVMPGDDAETQSGILTGRL